VKTLLSSRGFWRYASVFLFMPERILIGIWLAGICLQILLAVVLIARRVWIKFPVFCAYFLVNFVLGDLLFLIYAAPERRPQLYFYCYWGSQGLVLLLGLGVIFEILWRLLTPYPSLKKTVASACVLTVGALAVFDLIVLRSPHSAAALSANGPFLRAEEAIRVLQAGLVVFLYFFAGFFRLHWRQAEFGIALGMGVFSALQLIAVALAAHMGENVSSATGLLSMLAFDTAVLVWWRYLGRSSGRPSGH
jgi:hypothetical protein